MASPGPSAVGSPVDNTHNPDSSTSVVPTSNIQVSSLKVALPHGVYRHPLLKLVLDGHTIVKHDFNKNATELDWTLDVPYILHDGPSLTIQLCEGRMIGKSKVILELPISFHDACNATNTAPGERIELKLNEEPKVVLILASSPKQLYTEALKMGAEIIGQRKNVLDHLGRSRQSFETLLSLGDLISEVHPIAGVIFASVNAVYELLKEQERCNDLVLELADDMACTLEYVQDVEQFAREAQFVETLKELQLLLADTQNFIINYSSQSATANALSLPFSSKGHQIEDLKSRFERFKQQFDRGLAVQTAISLESLLVSAKDDKILEDLKPRGLGSDSLPPECMDGTRQDILNEIDEWIADLDAPNILWIKGHPGAGKSAIASSVVARLRGAKRIGSQFFFERAKAEVLTPSALWRKVAFDLSQNYPVIRKHLVAKLDIDHNLPTTGNLDDLFRQLIEEPLKSGDSIPIGRLPVIVIDALDECGGLNAQSEQRKRVLRTLSKWPSLPRKFKIVITSRAESDIGRVLQNISHTVEITTGSSVSHQSSTDIGMFLKVRFQEIVEGYPALNGWPGAEEILKLVKLAAGLFIWARVVADFVQDGDPREQLRRIQGGEGIAGDMTSLYSYILQISFPKPTPTVIINFHSILGTAILARRPLSARSLADLLGIDEISMQYIFDKLSSVVESKSVVRIIHQSFVDFLIDPTCPPPFHIDSEVEEHKLALACLRIMKSGLKFNICNLESSYRLNSEITDMESRIDRYIPSHLQYACWYWADHLAASKYDDEIMDLLDNFTSVQFLSWLEVLSVTKRMNTASHTVSSLINYLKKYQKDNTVAMDMQKFITAFSGVISQSAPHVYISALPFAPESLVISKKYKHRYPGVLKIEKGGLHGWPVIQNVFDGHIDAVNSIAFSPDGKWVVSGSRDKAVRIWDARTGETVAGPFEGHARAVLSVAFSPDGRRAVSGSEDKMIRMWDVETGGAVGGLFEGHTKGVRSVAFSPDGKRVASGSDDKTIRIWDAETGGAIAGPFEGHVDAVQSVAFSSDSSRVASGSFDKTIRIWDVETGKVVAGPFNGHVNMVQSVAFSPDGRRVASGSSDMTIRIWDAQTGEAAAEPFKGHTSSVRSVAFSPDGRYVVSGSMDKTIRIWDAETGKTVAGPLEGHASWVNSVAFSPDGGRVASGSSDKAIRIWDAQTGEGTGEAVVETFEGHSDRIKSVAFSPGGTHVASGSNDKTIRIWAAETGEAVAGPFEGHVDAVQSVAFSSDGRRIASASQDKTIKIWDAETGGAVAGPLEGHTDWVESVVYSPDGRRIASGSGDNKIRIWDAETGEAASRPFEGHTGTVRSVVFSPDGRHIASASDDKTIKIWDAETGEAVVGPFKGHTGWVNSVAFSSDGSRVASGSEDMMIRIWDAKTGEAVAGPFKGHTGVVNSVAFSPDGEHVASGSGDNTIRIWDTKTGEAVAEPLEGHTSWVQSLAFSLDGRYLVSGSNDNMVRIWDLKSDPNKPSFIDTSRMKEGWILDSHNNHLFWVPPSLRAGLIRSNNPVIIGKLLLTRLNFDAFEHGNSWTRCQASPSAPL